MPSLKQILANRANAQKSTGPRSPQGKGISSQNALSHGLASKKSIVLNGESRDRFDRLCRSFFEVFQPSNDVTALLVEEMAVAKWRTRRLWTIEAALYDHELDSIRQELDKNYASIDNETRVALAYKSLQDSSSCATSLKDHEQRLHRQFERTSALFYFLEATTGPPPPENKPISSHNVVEIVPRIPPSEEAA